MLKFISEEDWYKAHSTPSSRPLGPPTLMFSSSESQKAVLQEMQSERGVESDDKVYTVTAVGKALVQMDGPTQADVARFLAHLSNSETGMKRSTMSSNWKEIALWSGDAQSQRIADKVDDLISFCLDSRFIK